MPQDFHTAVIGSKGALLLFLDFNCDAGRAASGGGKFPGRPSINFRRTLINYIINSPARESRRDGGGAAAGIVWKDRRKL